MHEPDSSFLTLLLNGGTVVLGVPEVAVQEDIPPILMSRVFIFKSIKEYFGPVSKTIVILLLEVLDLNEPGFSVNSGSEIYWLFVGSLKL